MRKALLSFFYLVLYELLTLAVGSAVYGFVFMLIWNKIFPHICYFSWMESWGIVLMTKLIFKANNYIVE